MKPTIAIAIALFVLACGAPRAVVTPTAIPPTDVIVPTNTPEPTAMPEPTATPAPGKYISRDQLGDAWPLLVEDGTIICSGTAILLRTNRGLVAVNGTARGQKRWKDIFDITRAGMSVQPIIDRGLKVCKARG